VEAVQTSFHQTYHLDKVNFFVEANPFVEVNNDSDRVTPMSVMPNKAFEVMVSAVAYKETHTPMA
jgi:hypothetical protein